VQSLAGENNNLNQIFRSLSQISCQTFIFLNKRPEGLAKRKDDKLLVEKTFSIAQHQKHY
jgi:hypothetical protein